LSFEFKQSYKLKSLRFYSTLKQLFTIQSSGQVWNRHLACDEALPLQHSGQVWNRHLACDEVLPLQHSTLKTIIMQDFGDIIYNQVLLVALLACLIAQVSKLVIELAKNRKLNFRVLVTTGGMPSAHSALVTALATGVGQTIGWATPEFAIATIFAIIVMYDAAGVRQAAGKQARILNQMIDELFQEDSKFSEDRLKELLGHTPVQVIAGSILGVIVSWLACPTYQ
jgi:acid phosphatase family membrane protein YuiD